MKKFTAIFAIAALMLVASPASAWHNEDITVTNHNNADVYNDVDTSASTGGNTANAGDGSAAGDGGNVSNSSDDNDAGDGGNGGNGGEGGWIITGDAVAGSAVLNDVNYNKTKVVVGCDCEESNGVDDVTVTNHNHAKVKNYIDSEAKTGWNTANGGDSGCGCNGGGDGGDVTNSSDDNTAGNGGDAGDGGLGGLIETGSAGSITDVVNLVNTNITRVRR